MKQNTTIHCNSHTEFYLLLKGWVVERSFQACILRLVVHTKAAHSTTTCNWQRCQRVYPWQRRHWGENALSEMPVNTQPCPSNTKTRAKESHWFGFSQMLKHTGFHLEKSNSAKNTENGRSAIALRVTFITPHKQWKALNCGMLKAFVCWVPH